MGGCFSVSVSCDQVVNQISQCLCLKGSYIHNLPQNLASLEKAMGTLKAKRDDVQGRVNREEFTGHRRRLAQVQVWLNSILTMENKYNELLNTSEVELKRLCLCRLCSKNVKESYLYGKRVMVMVREVESLSSQGEFVVVTEETPIAEGEELPIQPTIVGQETTFEMVWNRLMEDEVGILGLYGMGGIGKTTLLTQINNRFSERGGRFDVVIWVVVSQDATVHKIQGSIGEKLGLRGKEWDEKTDLERAHDIHNVLRRKKFVLFLDDIWEKVSLDVIGVPYPDKLNGCKVAFTTRSREVCGRMGVDDPIEVRCLDTDKAWDLFKKKVGEHTLGRHQDIPELAMKVAGKCRGLPLALNVIGETMASKRSVREWRRAVDVLTSYATEFSGMEDEILPILKYSYDSLDGEMTKSCFLYCSLFPEDCLIDKKYLIEYWIGEGFIDEKEGRERAINQGYEILGTLVRACLLLEHDQNESLVKMHDVVREMAMWIASDLGKNKERCIVQAGVGIREIPKVKNWKDVRRISLMKNGIETISESADCPELTTLILQKNKLVEISDGFFQCMPKLLVLDLSWNFLSGFRMDMSSLVSLRYLNLSWTEISELPFGLEQLKMLTHLDLEGTSCLESLDGISGLSRLRTLRLLGSNVRLDMSLMKKLQLLEDLEYVSVNISSSTLAREKLFDDPRMGGCIQQVYIEGSQEELVKVLVLPALDGLHNISICDCRMLEEIKIEKTPWNKGLTSPCFSNLTNVKIIYCYGLKDLTWLLFAPNLTYLLVIDSVQLEDIISRETQSFDLKVLPEQISELVSLRYLDLSESSIVSLPVGLQKLKRLMHLNLESMLCLEGVSGISNLSSLKTLKLLNFIMWPTMSLLEELERLEHLEVLTVEITSSSVLKQLLCSHRLVRCLQKLSIKYIEEESVRVLTLPSIEDLREVFIGGSGIREIMIERNTMLTSPCLPHLSKVLIAGCNGLKDIISREKAASVLENERCNIIPFQNLEELNLYDLPELKSIYWNALPFQRLRHLYIGGRDSCPKLRKLPLNSKSVFDIGKLAINCDDKEWFERVEWEDEATRLRFLPSCKV